MVNCDEGHPGFLAVNGNYTRRVLSLMERVLESFGQLGMISVMMIL